MSLTQSNEIISMDEYNIHYINNENNYIQNINFKSINGEKRYQYAIMNNLNFDIFIHNLYNRITKDFGLNYNFEIIPSSYNTEYGLEIKDYLIFNNYNINQINSKDILMDTKSYYVRTIDEKNELYANVEPNSECPICYEKNILYKYYICYHKLCKNCNLNWKHKLGTTCPICRSC
jgi:hypothetical protein